MTVGSRPSHSSLTMAESHIFTSVVSVITPEDGVKVHKMNKLLQWWKTEIINAKILFVQGYLFM